MKALFASLLIATAGGLAWLISPPPPEPEGRIQRAPEFAYGVGSIEEIDRQRGLVTIRSGPLSAPHSAAVTVSYLMENKSLLGGLRPMQQVEFQARHDGKNYVLTDIRSRKEQSDQAGVLPACAFRHSGRASLSQTASARSAAPPRAT